MSGEHVSALVADAQHGNDANATGNSDARHRVAHAPVGKPSYSTFYERGKPYDGTHVRFYKQRDAVIGAPVGDAVDPALYLRKGGGVRYVAPTQSCDACAHTAHKPPVTAHTDRDSTPPATDSPHDNTAHTPSVNFVRDNIVAATHMVPKWRTVQPTPATQRDDFGAVPAYLHRVKREVAREAQALQAVQAHSEQRQAAAYAQYVHRLDAHAHAALLARLRERQSRATAALQRQPLHAGTTAAARQRRSALERDVAELDAAVQRLDHEAVFVYRDADGGGAHAQACKQAALDEARRYAQRGDA